MTDIDRRIDMIEEVNLLETTDAYVWASEFMKVVNNGAEIDEALMIGWFANMWAATNDPLQREIDSLQSRLDEAEARVRELAEQYYDLIMQVAQKIPHESRHETAKRYIREREQHCNGPEKNPRCHAAE